MKKISLLTFQTVELLKDTDGEYLVLYKGKTLKSFPGDALGLVEAIRYYEQTVMEQIL